MVESLSLDGHMVISLPLNHKSESPLGRGFHSLLQVHDRSSVYHANLPMDTIIKIFLYYNWNISERLE
jgi:hypothetical protein